MGLFNTIARLGSLLDGGGGAKTNDGPLMAESSHPESTYALPERSTRWASLVNDRTTEHSKGLNKYTNNYGFLRSLV